jgi:hypothetical protein
MLRPISSRFSSEAGIALGPILFLLAILGVLAAALSAGSGGFSTASVADRVNADIVSQANLIRAKINECTMLYGSNTDYTTYPQATTATLVSAITCPGDSSTNPIWSGSHPANLPPPTNGFGPWYYINKNTGGSSNGVCIWTQPTKSGGGIVQGLTHAATKFYSSASNDGAHEVNYDPTTSGQRFVVWISTPPATADTNCTPQ